MLFLIMTKDNPNIDWKAFESILKDEARNIWELYKANIIRNIWFTKKTKEAVLIIEEINEDKVKNILKEFPLIKKGLITYQIIELTSYDGFERIMEYSEDT